MATFLSETDRAALLDRLNALTPASRPRWGQFSVEGMLCHLREATRMATGTLHVPDSGKPAFRRFPLKPLILKVFPFPKGAPTAPLLLAPAPEPFDQAMTTLKASLTEFLAASDAAPVHPLFGPLTRAEWGALVHKHTDHHLRQFGV